MKDYCTLRPLVVRVQARMFIFWKFDILKFLGTHGPGPMGQGPWAGPMGPGLGPGGRGSGRLETGGVGGRSPPTHFCCIFLNNFVRACSSPDAL